MNSIKKIKTDQQNQLMSSSHREYKELQIYEEYFFFDLCIFL